MSGRSLLVVEVLAVTGCSGQVSQLAGDGGSAGGLDAGVDGGRPDAGQDAGSDAGLENTDAGLYCTPPSIDFGTLNFGEAALRTLTCSNARNYAADMEIGVPEEPFQVLSFICPEVPEGSCTLNAGASSSLDLVYAPMGASTDTATLQVIGFFRDGLTLTAYVPLAGIGTVLPCELSITPNALAYGQVIVGTSVTREFTMTNEGPNACLVSVGLSSDCSPAFSLPYGPIPPLSLAPAGSGAGFRSSVSFPVAFSPQDAGIFYCGLVGMDGGPDTRYFSGEGVEPTRDGG